MTKVCSLCKVEKNLDAFTKRKSSKDGLHFSCAECKNITRRRAYEQNPAVVLERNAAWVKNNPSRVRESKRKDYLNNLERYKRGNASRYLKETNAAKLRREEYRISHKQERNARHRNRMRTDVQYRLQFNLRSRLSQALLNGYKTGSAVRDLGCSIQHLKLHLELFWDEGMTWENYGKENGQWSIDHIKPLSSFDLTERTQLLCAVHYTNLQPLWHIDNMTKGNRINPSMGT